MPHELSITDGVVSFADSRVDANGRVDAWHKLGTPVGHAMTAQEALEAAHLARWNVRKTPLQTKVGGRVLQVPDQYATVFNNPANGEVTPIGVVGKRYTPIANEALTEFADALIDESGGAHYETAGALQEYSKVFLSILLPQTMRLVGKNGDEDVTLFYLTLFNSHDGSTSMFGTVSQIRTVCANTARANIRGAVSRFSVPHTLNWKKGLQVVRDTLGLAFAYDEAFEAEARALFDEPFSFDEARAFSESLVDLKGAKEGTVARTKRQNTASAILKLFVESPTIKGTPIEGTRFGAFNAVTEYVDHYQGVRGAGDDAEAQSILRATRALVSIGAGATDLKTQAWTALTN